MKRIKTISLLGMVGFLLVTTIYISWQLQQEQSPSSPTVIRQTKASSVTYRRTVDVNAAVTPTESITPDLTQSLVSSLSADVSVASISATPTEIILAKANPSATPSATQKATKLPETGWIQMTTVLFISASVFILFSFLF